MTKADLVEKLAGDGLDLEKAVVTVETVLDGIKNALLSGGKVSIVGFGTFLVKDKAARRGRNPKTGQARVLPAKMQPCFNASAVLKKSVDDALRGQME